MNTLWLAFIFKHIVIDYYLQFPFMYLNKGKYGNLKGLSHSLSHGIGTFLVLLCFGFELNILLLAFLFDTVLHYHIDYAKSNLMRRNKYSSADQMYWILHGTDQGLHLLTYFVIIEFVTVTGINLW